MDIPHPFLQGSWATNNNLTPLLLLPLDSGSAPHLGGR